MKLTPWGAISVERQEQAGTDPMSDWPASKSWQQFFDTRANEFADHLWPRWKDGQWVGKAARNADAATLAELNICMTHLQQADILGSYPQMHLEAGEETEQRTHLWHYKVEDFIGYDNMAIGYGPEAAKPISNLPLYDPSQNQAKIWGQFADLAGRKTVGTFRFKLEFLRPRPYSAATILGIPGFKHRTASRHIHTGVHPAFPSGHCLQGLMVGAGLIDDMLANEKTLDEINVDAIMQYAVDFGDRRVFAGVHYPTDNIASWVNAVHLSRLIFKNPEVIETIIRDAIRKKSKVYQIIDEFYRKEPDLASAVEFVTQHI